MPNTAELISESAFSLISGVHIDGIPAKRLMIVLRTNGCTYDHNKNGCSMCDFSRHAVDAKSHKITARDLLSQLNKALQTNALNQRDLFQIDLLTLGSFFNDSEVSAEARVMLLEKVCTLPQIRKVLVESRAEFINPARLEDSKNLLRRDQILELGIGVESANEFIRNGVLKKNLRWEDLEKVVSLCRDYGLHFLSYLLIKPETLNEHDAIADAVVSAERIADLANKYCVPLRIAFEPVFITQGKSLEQAYLRGDYQIVNLWSVIEVIKRTARLGTVFVGMSDENLSGNRMPRSCDICNEKLHIAIERFNTYQDVGVFDSITCICHDEWEKTS